MPADEANPPVAPPAAPLAASPAAPPAAPLAASPDGPARLAPRSAELAALDRLRASGPKTKGRPRPAADEQWTGRDPMLVADAISGLIAERGWETMIRDAEVTTRFAAIVGPDIAAHATVRSFDDDILVIQATETAWATQLRLLIPQLMARFAEVLGPAAVGSIEVVGPARPPQGRRRFRPGRR